MVKRGRPVKNPKTIIDQIMKNPPPHIPERRSRRQNVSFLWKKVWCTTEKHHKTVEAVRKKLQVRRSDLDRVLAGYSEGVTEEQLKEAWSVLDKRQEKMAADVSGGGKAKSQRGKPAWQCQVTRLIEEIEHRRAGIAKKLSASRLAELVLLRWPHRMVNAPSHGTLRKYLSKSL